MNEIKDMQFTLFVKNSDFIVRDYNLHKVAVLPAVTFIDIIYRFLISKGIDAKEVELRNLFFKTPVISSRDIDVKLQVSLKKSKDCYELTARSQNISKKVKTLNDWEENFQCSIYFVKDEMSQKTIEVQDLISKCETKLEIESLYNIARKFEAVHHDFMKTKGIVHISEKHWIAQLGLTEVGEQYIDYFHIHPAYLDACMIILYNFVKDKKIERKPFVPMYIESVRTFDSIKKTSYVSVDPAQIKLIGDEVLNSNIEIYDLYGKISVILQGISLKPLEEKAIISYQNDRKKIIPEDFNSTYFTEYASKAKSIKELIIMDLKKITSGIIRQPEESITETESFYKLGFDSRLLLEFAYRLNIRMNRKINPTILFGYPNIGELSGYINRYLREIYEQEFKRLGKDYAIEPSEDLNMNSSKKAKVVPEEVVIKYFGDNRKIEDGEAEVSFKKHQETQRVVQNKNLTMKENSTTKQDYIVDKSFTSGKNFTVDENFTSGKNFTVDENFTSGENFYEDDNFTSGENFYEGDNFTSGENFVEDDNFTSGESFIGDDNFTSRENFTGEENLATDLELIEANSNHFHNQELAKADESNVDEFDVESIAKDLFDELYSDLENNLNDSYEENEEEVANEPDNTKRQPVDEIYEEDPVEIRKIYDDIVLLISNLSGLNLELINIDEWDFSEELDSEILIKLINTIGTKVGDKISPTVIFRNRTIQLLSKYIYFEFGNVYTFEPEISEEEYDNENYLDLEATIEDKNDVLTDNNVNVNELLFVLSAKDSNDLFDCATRLDSYIKELNAQSNGFKELEALTYALFSRPSSKVRLAFKINSFDELLSKLDKYLSYEKTPDLFSGIAIPRLAEAYFDISKCANLNEIAQVWIEGVNFNIDDLFPNKKEIAQLIIPKSIFEGLEDEVVIQDEVIDETSQSTLFDECELSEDSTNDEILEDINPNFDETNCENNETDIEAERIKAEEELRLAQEEQRIKAEEESRLAQEEQRIKAEEEARLAQEEQRIKSEEEARLAQEERRIKAEEESRLAQEEQRIKVEEEARLAQEEQRIKAEEEARLAQEEQRIKAEEESRLAQEEQRIKAEDERKDVENSNELSKEKFFLYEIAGQRFSPFSTYIAQITETAQISKGVNYKEISNIRWGEPVPSDLSESITTAFLEENGELKFFVYSNHEEETKNVHLKGNLFQDAEVDECLFDVEDVKSKLNMFSGDIYEEIKKMKIKIYDPLKIINTVYKGKNQTLARINRIADGRNAPEGSNISIIEGVIQTIYMGLSSEDIGKNVVCSPHSCNGIQITDIPISEEFYVYVKEVLRMNKDGIIRFNAVVIDLEGKIILKIKDIIYKINPMDVWLEKTKLILRENTITGEVLTMKNTNEKAELSKTNEPIAIIGMSGRMPMSDDLWTLSDNIASMKNLISDIPSIRRELLGAELALSSQVLPDEELLKGGYIENLEKFDHDFFEIKESEAQIMDPQQRLFLEVVWNAIEDSGYRMYEISKANVGVFIGVTSGEYSNIVLKNGKEITPELFSGINLHYIPNRISKVFDFKGPSEIVNTGGTSSISALKRAVDELHNGNCEVAIAGGVNLLLSYDNSNLMDKMGLISRRGVVAPFDIEADGFVRSEGVGAIIMKPLSKAISDNDNIYAVIKGINVAHGGCASSLMLADSDNGANVICSAWEMSGLNPSTADYIEMSAQGVPFEDKAEVNSLKLAFERLSQNHENEQISSKKIKLGSVRSYAGNLEAASGMAGIFNVLLGLCTSKKPGVLNLNNHNPDINLKETHFEIASDSEEWKHVVSNGNKIPRVAAINSVSMGGVSGHVVLEEYMRDLSTCKSTTVSQPNIFLFSAKNEERLKDYIMKFINFVTNERNINKLDIDDIAYTLQLGRVSMGQRLAVITDSLESLVDELKAYLNERVNNEVVFSGNINASKSKFVPIFDGEEADAFVRLLMENKNYKNMVQLWILGIELDWKQMYVGKKVKRISLPGYQFKGPKCWVNATNSKFKPLTKEPE